MSLTVWGKVAAVVGAAAVCFVGGYWVAAQVYKREIQEMISDYERRSKVAQEEQNAKLLAEREKNAKTTSELLEKLNDFSVRQRNASATADRLQRELANRAKVSGAKSSSCADCEKRFARCSELLSEGIGLAQEGGDLAERIAIRKDAVVSFGYEKKGKE